MVKNETKNPLLLTIMHTLTSETFVSNGHVMDNKGKQQ